MKSYRIVIGTAAVLLIIGAVAAAGVVLSGFVSVAATDPHSPFVSAILHEAALRSIARHARTIEVPDLSGEDKIISGSQLFHRNCAQCHGAPGQAPADFAKGFEPGAPNLTQVGREWRPAALYWTIAHGIKMTAMPAWEFRMSDDEIWALVAFLQKLPALSPARYGSMIATPTGNPSAAKGPRPLREGDPRRGRIALQQYACASCHAIPGLSEAGGHVGPPLAGLAERGYIAGLLSNSPHHLVEWLRHPQQIKRDTLMPDMGVSDQDAWDMAAYLATLR